jgi:hypothetical protein
LPISTVCDEKDRHKLDEEFPLILITPLLHPLLDPPPRPAGSARRLKGRAVPRLSPAPPGVDGRNVTFHSCCSASTTTRGGGRSTPRVGLVEYVSRMAASPSLEAHRGFRTSTDATSCPCPVLVVRATMTRSSPRHEVAAALPSGCFRWLLHRSAWLLIAAVAIEEAEVKESSSIADCCLQVPE